MAKGLERRLRELRKELAMQNTAVLVQNCGAKVGDEQLEMSVWGSLVSITIPGFIICHAETNSKPDLLMEALILYYLHTSDGTPTAGEWIAFTDLPDGRFYTKAFQGYTGRELEQAFGNDVNRFKAKAVACGGQPESFGDAAFRFQVLPRIPILAVCWQGDEDFPPSYKILFDANTRHHLPTDACAIMGGLLTRRLLR